MAKISDVLDKLEKQNPDFHKEYSDEEKANIRASLAQSIGKIREQPKLFVKQIRDSLSFEPQLDTLSFRPPEQPDPMNCLPDLEEIESPFPEINEHLRNMATSMENLHQEQLKENQQAKTTKRIAILTLITAVVTPILISLLTTDLVDRVVVWANLLLNWFTST